MIEHLLYGVLQVASDWDTNHTRRRGVKLSATQQPAAKCSCSSESKSAGPGVPSGYNLRQKPTSISNAEYSLSNDLCCEAVQARPFAATHAGNTDLAMPSSKDGGRKCLAGSREICAASRTMGLPPNSSACERSQAIRVCSWQPKSVADRDALICDEAR